MPVKIFLGETLVSDFTKESTNLFFGKESMIRDGKVSFMMVVSGATGFVTLFMIVSFFVFIESFLMEIESLTMVSGKDFLIVSTWELATTGKIKKIKKRKYKYFILVKI